MSCLQVCPGVAPDSLVVAPERAPPMALPQHVPADVRAEWRGAWEELQAALGRHREAQERLIARLAAPTAVAATATAPAGDSAARAPLPEATGAEAESPQHFDPGLLAAAAQPSQPASWRSSLPHWRHGPSEASASPPNSAAPGEKVLSFAQSESSERSGREEDPDQCDAAGAYVEALSYDQRDELVDHLARSEQLLGFDVERARDMRDRALRQAGCANKLKALALDALLWWVDLREPRRRGPLARFIRSSWWAALVAIVIALNSLFMAISADHGIQHVSDSPDSGSSMQIQAIESSFLVFFAFELSFRLAVHRWYFFCNSEMSWNIFDFSIVMLAAYDVFAPLVLSATRDWDNVSFMRSLRLMRLARTLRMIRIFKYASSLRRMLQSVMGSFMSLFWSFALLFFIFYLFSIATVQGVTAYLASDADTGGDELVRQQLYAYFGTVFRTMLTYYMATSGGSDWSEFYNVLVKTSDATTFLFVFVVSFTQIALLNIMTGVFVENAMKLAQPDQHDMALELRKSDRQDTRELRKLLKRLDIDCSGSITWNEFKSVTDDPLVAALLEVMGLDIKDARLMFDMLCQSAGVEEVDFDFLVQSCMRMKGPATSLDLQALTFKTDSLAAELRRISKNIEDGSRLDLCL